MPVPDRDRDRLFIRPGGLQPAPIRFNRIQLAAKSTPLIETCEGRWNIKRNYQKKRRKRNRNSRARPHTHNKNRNGSENEKKTTNNQPDDQREARAIRIGVPHRMKRVADVTGYRVFFREKLGKRRAIIGRPEVAWWKTIDHRS